MHRVAVYGSLKQGYHNHPLLEGYPCQNTDVIQGWDMVDLGSFPGIFKGDGEIHVEIYEVDDSGMGRLDMLEGYPTFYNRTQVDTSEGKAWIYYLNNPSRYDDCAKVEGGKW